MTQSKLRQLQDQMRNQGWRIAWIPHDDGTRAEWYPTNWPALAGALGFLGGLGLVFLQVTQAMPSWGVVVGLAVAAGSLVLMFLSIWWQGWRRHRGWVEVTARCVDSEHRQVRTPVQHGQAWDARLVCEFDFNGQSYRATPAVHYRTFSTEAGLLRYLLSRVSEDGTCRLHVNPANPLECELAGQGIKERLLYGRGAVDSAILTA